jgi:2'-5' RNA ligase
MVRAFVGIGLEPLEHALAALLEGLASTGADAKLVEPENLHINLKFLGEIGEERVPPLVGALSEAAGRHAPFAVRLRGLGAFPSPRQPRVVWVGLEPWGELEALHRDVELAAARAGFPREGRRFSPHVTLARVRSARGRDALLALIGRMREAEVGALEVSSFSLVRSTLSTSGPTYEPLSTHPLTGTGA